MPRFEMSTAVPASTEELFAWHERLGALLRLLPPFEPVELVSKTGQGLEVGVRIEVAARLGPLRLTGVSRHVECQRPTGFVDEQERGPFAQWRHQHLFADGLVTDRIDWELPLGAVGRLAEGQVHARFERAFRFRHQRIVDDLERLAPHKDKPRQQIGLTGAGGLVGSALSHFLDAGGHTVVPFTRKEGEPGSVRWDPAAGTVDGEALEKLDVLIHLAGEPIAEHRWSEEHKEKILRSRVDGTRLLCEAMAARPRRPRVLLVASAVGFYGDRGEELLDEDAPRGEGFLADVVQAWEAAAAPAREAGIRVVHLRFGLVLSARGGILAQLLPVFRAGMGGPVGSGQQWQPWVALDDVVGAAHHAMWDDELEGPVNVVAPHPERQVELARILGRALGRPAIVPAPAPALRLLKGAELVDELLLASQRATPARLLARKFTFRHPTLEEALAVELGVHPPQRERA
jgi:uncharacterized protein (TIGR01777 family)